MGFCEFDGVGLLPYKGAAILTFITIKFDLLGLSWKENLSRRRLVRMKSIKILPRNSYLRREEAGNRRPRKRQLLNSSSKALQMEQKVRR
jgi:hypothetical protein